MSILPAFKAVLDNGLNDDQVDGVLKDIKKINGVLSAAFNAESGQKHVLVSYYHTLHSNGSGNSVEDKVRKIPGVTGIKPVL